MYSNSCIVTVMYCDYEQRNVSLTLFLDRCSSQAWYMGGYTKKRVQEIFDRRADQETQRWRLQLEYAGVEEFDDSTKQCKSFYCWAYWACVETLDR